jgi:hypothetical protein
VKDSRQFKQREKRLLKVVTVNLSSYKNNYNTKTLYFVVRRLSNVGEAGSTPKMAGKSAVRKANSKSSFWGPFKRITATKNSWKKTL